jgi:hypothetical protein
MKMGTLPGLFSNLTAGQIGECPVFPRICLPHNTSILGNY